MRGAPNFAAAYGSLALATAPAKSAPPRPAGAAAARSLTQAGPDRRSASVPNEQTEVHMYTQTARTQAWLLELASIQAEIAVQGMPIPVVQPARRRARKLKPFWEE